MRFRLTVVAGIAALASAACAPGLRRAVFGEPDRSRSWPQPRTLPRASRAEFFPTRFDDIFARAVMLMRENGLEIGSCESWRGALATAPVEFDAPCGTSTCLARETTEVKLGYRRARVTVTREVWDTAVRGWREQKENGTLEELSREERDLLLRMLVAARPARGSGGADPCARLHCGDGNCLAVSTLTMR